jgi:hypothetical protein
MSYQVFISYANEDKLVADAICAKLEENKIRCWIAPRDIAPGDKYASALINAIDHSEVVVVVFSSESDKSPHVRTEIERAFNKEKIIIPFRIENIEPCDEMQYFIGTRHWLDALTPPLEEHIYKLITILKVNFNNKTDFKKNENELKNNITEKKDVIKLEKGKYCPLHYRVGSFVIDLFLGLIFGIFLLLIFIIVVGSSMGLYNFLPLVTSSPGVNTRFGNFIALMWIVGGMTLWVIIIDSYKNFPVSGKNLLNLTISHSSKNSNLKIWTFFRIIIKIIPFLIMLIGIVIY